MLDITEDSGLGPLALMPRSAILPRWHRRFPRPRCTGAPTTTASESTCVAQMRGRWATACTSRARPCPVGRKYSVRELDLIRSRWWGGHCGTRSASCPRTRLPARHGRPAMRGI